MSLILHCNCGHQLTLSKEEARELTWCPRCRKVLVRPRLYQAAEGSYTRPGAAPSPAGGANNNLLPLRLVTVGVIYIVCSGLVSLPQVFFNNHPNEPSPGLPTFRPQPVDWDGLPNNFPGRPIDPEGFRLPDPAERPKVDDPLAPFRPGVDVFPGVRPGGPERRPDDP
jgi:hypothetical protein